MARHKRELTEYLPCGVLAHGFARVRCTTCHDEIVIAFSCKRRQLSLRFAFELEVPGLAAGSAAEHDHARAMESAYLGAVDATLAAIRKLRDEPGSR